MEHKILYKELSYKIYGLCYQTHNDLGRFRSEKTYADYFEKILVVSKITYEREKPVGGFLEEKKNRRNIPDFIIDNKIVVDFKAKDILSKEDYFQMKRYLSASKLRLGIIVNFRPPHIYPKRILLPYS